MKLKTIGTTLLAALAAYVIGTKSAQADNIIVTNVSVTDNSSALVGSGPQRTRYIGNFDLEKSGSLNLGLERNYERLDQPDRFQIIYATPQLGRFKPQIMLFGKLDNAKSYLKKVDQTSKNTFNPTLYTDIDLGKGYTLTLMDFNTFQKGAKSTEYTGELISGTLGKYRIHAGAFQSGNMLGGDDNKVTHAGMIGANATFGKHTVYSGMGLDFDNRIINVSMYNGGNVGGFAVAKYSPITKEFKLNLQGASGDINDGIFSTGSGESVLSDEVQEGSTFMATRYSVLPVKTKNGVVAQLKFTSTPLGHTGYTAVGYSTPHIGAALGPEFVATKDKTQTGLVGFVQANTKLPLHLIVSELKDPVGSVEISYNQNTNTWDAFTKVTYDFGGK